jgi:hypothetical protein
MTLNPPLFGSSVKKTLPEKLDATWVSVIEEATLALLTSWVKNWGATRLTLSEYFVLAEVDTARHHSSATARFAKTATYRE